ncbi:MAG: hypothetical protein ACXADY_26265, partial [Candidatus Hodarchaeales archaeon]
MKEIRNGTTLFLLLVLIFAFSAQGSLYFFQFDRKNSHFSSSSAKVITPLRKNILPPTNTPRTGIIPTSNAPRGSIDTILNPLPQYFPGSNISISNKFEITPGLAIVQQVIFIFLFNENSWTVQEMIDEGNITDPMHNSSYYVHNATTNGIPEGAASYSTNPNHGYINTTFTIPSLTELQAINIGSDDNVTIFQFYPANNETSLISKSIYQTDTFKLSAAAEFDLEEEFINLDSNTNSFRQGESATALLNATSGDTPIENVTVTSWKLYNSTAFEITDPTSLGIKVEFRDELLDTPTFTTDASGELELFVNTTYLTTPEDEYYFNITANFQWTNPQFYTDNYVQGDPSSNTDFVIANFTVQNVPDIVTNALFTIGKEPTTSMDPPNVNVTIVTVTIQAQDGYGGSNYDLSNIPVNATLDIQELWVNITTGASFNGTQGWYLTDSNGEIKFNITAGFPLPYENKTPIITVIADLQNTLAPIYPPGEPHRFLQNSTGGKIVSKT